MARDGGARPQPFGIAGRLFEHQRGCRNLDAEAGERLRPSAHDGMTQVARHKSSADGVNWTASMDVTLRKVA